MSKTAIPAADAAAPQPGREPGQEPGPDLVTDPRPEPPQPPGPGDCCHSGCAYCVDDIYQDALDQYRADLKAWQARHP